MTQPVRHIKQSSRFTGGETFSKCVLTRRSCVHIVQLVNLRWQSKGVVGGKKNCLRGCQVDVLSLWALPTLRHSVCSQSTLVLEFSLTFPHFYRNSLTVIKLPIFCLLSALSTELVSMIHSMLIVSHFRGRLFKITCHCHETHKAK